jgi:hypothetical protein
VENPFDNVIYDRDFAFQGFPTNPVSMEFTPVWTGGKTTDPSVGQIVLPADHDYSEQLQAEGARVTIAYRGVDEMSGWIDSHDGDMVLPGGNVTYQVLGDECVLDEVLAWVAPDRPLGAATLTSLAQGTLPSGSVVAGTVTNQDGYYIWPAGTATTVEGAVKQILKANIIDRLGLPFTVAPNLGRGGVPDLPRVRFSTLREAIAPLLEQSGLGVVIMQPKSGGSIVIDVVEPDPAKWSQEVTPEAGILVGSNVSRSAPVATRAVLGGPGDIAARVFFSSTTGPVRTEEEAAWGRVIEVWRDATGARIEYPGDLEEIYRVAKYAHLQVPGAAAMLASYFQEEERKALADKAATSGISTELAESETFFYGGVDGYRRGDWLRMRIRGLLYTEQLLKATLKSSKAGTKVTPVVGQRTDDPDKEIADALMVLARAAQRAQTAK